MRSISLEKKEVDLVYFYIILNIFIFMCLPFYRPQSHWKDLYFLKIFYINVLKLVFTEFFLWHNTKQNPEAHRQLTSVWV